MLGDRSTPWTPSHMNPLLYMFSHLSFLIYSEVGPCTTMQCVTPVTKKLEIPAEAQLANFYPAARAAFPRHPNLKRKNKKKRNKNYELCHLTLPELGELCICTVSFPSSVLLCLLYQRCIVCCISTVSFSVSVLRRSLHQYSIIHCISTVSSSASVQLCSLN